MNKHRQGGYEGPKNPKSPTKQQIPKIAVSKERNELVERVAIVLDYLELEPTNVLRAWEGRGKGGLGDRDMIWELSADHLLAMSDRRKEQFREAARLVLYEIGIKEADK